MSEFAEETANLTQARILSASNLSVLTEANQGPEMALQLFRSLIKMDFLNN